MASSAGKAVDYDSGKQAPVWRGPLARRVSLPRALYSAVPLFYLACAISALFATLYVAEWFWLVPHYILFSFALVHIAVFVFRRRRKSEDPDRPPSL